MTAKYVLEVDDANLTDKSDLIHFFGFRILGR